MRVTLPRFHRVRVAHYYYVNRPCTPSFDKMKPFFHETKHDLGPDNHNLTNYNCSCQHDILSNWKNSAILCFPSHPNKHILHLVQDSMARVIILQLAGFYAVLLLHYFPIAGKDGVAPPIAGFQSKSLC